MRLFIAEKPSLARAIVSALPKPHTKHDGYYLTGDGDMVSWCIGHLLELAEPHDYQPEFKQWRHEHLPIVPQQWQMIPKRKTKKQLSVLKKLIRKSDALINAGDPDREGQLLVDEVIHYSQPGAVKVNNCLRCLISDLNVGAVTKALNNMRPNKEFAPLSTSALARSRADWLYGINLTRAYTLQGKKAGYNGVLSIGRVQTPVLGLVVKRDLEIQDFIPRAFYEVIANLETEDKQVFKAKWLPSEACGKYLDEQGRNLSRPLATNVAQRIQNHPAAVESVSKKTQKISPPLPFNLSTLQIEANKAFGMKAQTVLDICQDLYEKHKVITYPRSDCRYLPEDQLKDVTKVVSGIQGSGVQFNRLKIDEISFNFAQRSKAWNSKKVTAHHAIIPTFKKPGGLNESELKVYSLVARNYLAQFLENQEISKTQVIVKILTGLFKAHESEVLQAGWKVIFPSNKKTERDTNKLPALVKGQQLNSLDSEVLEKFTSPPEHFTDATLLSAMTGINKFVKDPNIKSILKETDGLGTEATRAGILELLEKRGFLQRNKKQITATTTGIAFINSLPEKITLPDMTAHWESKLSLIAEGQTSYQTLLTDIENQLQTMTKESQNILPQGLGSGGSPKYRKKASRLKRTYNKKGSQKRAHAA